MSAGAVGTSWATGTWSGTAWQAGSWASPVLGHLAVDIIVRLVPDDYVVRMPADDSVVSIQADAEVSL